MQELYKFSTFSISNYFNEDITNRFLKDLYLLILDFNVMFILIIVLYIH